MTTLRQNAISLMETIPEDKLEFIIQFVSKLTSNIEDIENKEKSLKSYEELIRFRDKYKTILQESGADYSWERAMNEKYGSID